MTAVVSDLSGGTTYTVMVAARNTVGQGPASNSATITPTAVAAPDAITDLSGITDGFSQVDLSFTAPGGGGRPLAGYEYSTDGGTTWSAENLSVSTPDGVHMHMVIVAKVPPGTVMAVRSYDEAGLRSPASNPFPVS